jgi:hypothetical protein
LAGGAYFIATRSKTRAVPDFVASDIDAPPAIAAARPAPVGRPGLLLEALKEELFQLEVDRKQGNLSQQEYEKAKAALDQTLERALKRETAKT